MDTTAQEHEPPQATEVRNRPLSPEQVAAIIDFNPDEEARAAAPGIGQAMRPFLSPGREVETVDPHKFYMQGMGLASVPRQPGREIDLLKMLKLLRTYDADAAAAVTTALRIANSGHTVEVLTRDGAAHPEGTTRVNTLAKRVWEPGGGGTDALVNCLNLSQMTYGGTGIDVAPLPSLMEVRDAYPFTPAEIDFRTVFNEATQEPEQVAYPRETIPGRDAAPINMNQVRYLPIDAEPDDPYGTPQILPGVSSLIGLISLLHEVQSVAKIAGYGQRDVVISEAAAKASAPAYLHQPGSEAGMSSYLTALRKEIEKAIKDIRATDAYVHYDNLVVNTTQPSVRGIPLDPVMLQYGRRIVTGLKTMPFLLGAAEGTQTQSTVQWQVYAIGLQTMTNNTERLLEFMYNVALTLWGIDAHANVTFNPIRKTDRVMDASAQASEDTNSYNRYYWGIDSHKTFANRVAEHDPEGPPPPTAADVFAAGQFASLFPASEIGGEIPDAPGTIAPATPAEGTAQPGTDAGVTAEEGAALDGISTGAGAPAPADAANVAPAPALPAAAPAPAPAPAPRRYKRATEVLDDGTVVPDLGENAADVLGKDIVEDTRNTLRDLGASELINFLDAGLDEAIEAAQEQEQAEDEAE
jgi:hypothetical protein